MKEFTDLSYRELVALSRIVHGAILKNNSFDFNDENERGLFCAMIIAKIQRLFKEAPSATIDMINKVLSHNKAE